MQCRQARARRSKREATTPSGKCEAKEEEAEDGGTMLTGDRCQGRGDGGGDDKRKEKMMPTRRTWRGGKGIRRIRVFNMKDNLVILYKK